MSTAAQGDLFAYRAPPKPRRETPREIQARELQRVSGRIAEAILAFCRVHVGQEFAADDLRQHVARECKVAPGSADRILRQLRQAGRVSYEVTNRAASRYRCDGVK